MQYATLDDTNDEYHSYILLKDKGGSFSRGHLLEHGLDYHYRVHTHYRYSHLESLDSQLVGSDEVALLSKQECILLDAMGCTDEDRYIVYTTPGKLAWGVGLKVGDPVLARLPSKRGHGSSGEEGEQDCYVAAVIRWCGHGKYESMHRFGVEITDDRYYGCGDNDGAYNKGESWEERFFSCPENCAIFLTLAEMKPPSSSSGADADLQDSSIESLSLEDSLDTVSKDVSALKESSQVAVLSSSSTPKLHQLVLLKAGGRKKRIIEEVGVDWEKLALMLEFDHTMIRTIKENNSWKEERIEESCRDMLGRWLDGKACSTVSWGRLIEAIRDIPRDTLATEIEGLLN